MPTEIGLLSNNLQILHLSENDLAGSIPEQIGLLQELEELYLHGNPYIIGTIPGNALGSMLNLRELTLDGTSVMGTLPDELCTLSLLAVNCAVDTNSNGSGVCGCECGCT